MALVTREGTIARTKGAQSAKRQLPTTAVLGAAPNGLALAGYLAQKGAPVHIWNQSLAPLQAIQLLGGIQFNQELVRPARVTAAIAQALQEAEVVMVTQAPSALAETVRTMAPYLADGQQILLVGAGIGAALEFRRLYEATEYQSRLVVAEVPAFPLDSLSTGPAMTRVLAVKQWLPVAALPQRCTGEVVERCGELLPMLKPVSSVLESSLQNTIVLMHAVITLLNAERIRRKERFRFYAEGVTPHVAEVLAMVDAERCAVARAYGVQVLSMEEYLTQAYGVHVKGLQAKLLSVGAFQDKLAPSGLMHRYVDEDVPAGLVPLWELAELAGVECPTLEQMIDLASSLTGRDYLREGRSLARMGLTGLTPDQVRLAVQ